MQTMFHQRGYIILHSFKYQYFIKMTEIKEQSTQELTALLGQPGDKTGGYPAGGCIQRVGIAKGNKRRTHSWSQIPPGQMGKLYGLDRGGQTQTDSS